MSISCAIVSNAVSFSALLYEFVIRRCLMKKLIAALCLCTFCSAPAFAAEKIVAATNPTWPPMEMVDLDKNIVGYDMDIVAAVAAEMGMEVEFKSVAWDGIFANLESKQSDLLASAVTITDARKKKYAFSDPYYTVSQSLIVPEDSKIDSMDDLKGKNVGIQIGTTALIPLQESGVKMNIKTYDDIGLVFEDLKNGRLDAAMCDDPVGLYYANRKEGFDEHMKVAFLAEGSEQFGFVFLKSNQELVDKFNQGLKAIQANGTEAKIREKWFGKE